MTGKGFPDGSTIRLLKTILGSTDCDVTYIGDLDPHGICIYLNYLQRLCIIDPSRLRWLGLSTLDVKTIEYLQPNLTELGMSVGVDIFTSDFSSQIGIGAFWLVYSERPVSLRLC